jgi:hypothetical protein
MEWLTLLLLIPALVVPVVLLFGYAGCTFSVPIVPDPQAPDITAATPLDGNTIRLEWTNPNTISVTFDILRTPEGPGPPPAPDQQSPFIDQQLTPGETYSYRVRAIAGGFESEYSNVATARTWADAFTVDLDNNGQDVDVANDCIVQRFEPAALLRGGNLIKVQGRAANGGKLVIKKVTFSQAAAVGDAFDSQATPVAGTWPPGQPPGPPFVADPGETFSAQNAADADFEVETSRPLLVAFDVGDPGNTRLATVDNATATAFVKPGTAQQPATDASLPGRSGFTPNPKQVRIITHISVATKWP